MSTAMATAAAVAAEILLRVPVAPAALPHQVTAGDLTYDCLAATGRACPLAARDGTGLLEIVRRADGTLQARLVASAQLPRNAPLVVAGVVREADARSGRAVVGGYRVDFTPLMHCPRAGEWRIGTRDGTPDRSENPAAGADAAGDYRIGGAHPPRDHRVGQSRAIAPNEVVQKHHFIPDS